MKSLTLNSFTTKHFVIFFAVILTVTSLSFLQSQETTKYTTDGVGQSFEETIFAHLKEFKRRNNLEGSLFHMDLFPMTKKMNAGNRIYVIQIGANRGEDIVKGNNLDDPIVDYVLDEQTNGLLIEAVPSNFDILLKNTEVYSNRYKRVNAAVIHPKLSETMPFYTVNTTRVLEKWADAPFWIAKNRIGSFNEDHVRKHLIGYTEQLYRTGDWAKHYIAKINLPTKEPAEIIDIMYQSFPESNTDEADLSLLHVDAEGYDWKIVKPFLDITTPKIIVFEKNHLPEEEIKDSLEVLKKDGFATWMSGNNIYAVHLGESLLGKL